MKKVKLEITRIIQSSGYSPVYDKEDYNVELYEKSPDIFVSSVQIDTDKAFVPEYTYIFYENGENIFSRFDSLGQEKENSIKIAEIKEDSVVMLHKGYQQLISIDDKEIKDHDKKFEVNIGEVVYLHSFAYDIDISYSIKVCEIDL